MAARLNLPENEWLVFSPLAKKLLVVIGFPDPYSYQIVVRI